MTQVAQQHADLTGDPSRRRRERVTAAVLRAAAIVSVSISLLIVVSLIGKAFAFLQAVDLGTFWSSGWYPRRGSFDIKTIISASVIVSTISLLVAGPLGLGAAIYLSEFARPRARRTLKPILEVLAGVPSVVLGYFALTVINPKLVQTFIPSAEGFNMLAAGIGVGILVTPLMASVSEDALRSVPGSLREASYGLGAGRRLTVIRVVLPAAVSGIVASAIIAISRAIGETMVVSLAGGARGLFTVDPREGSLTMTAAIANLATGTDAVAGDTLAVPSLFFVGLMLFAFTLVLNTIGDRVVRKYRKAY